MKRDNEDYEQYERPPRINNEAQEIERLLILLAVDGGLSLTSSLSTKSHLSTRQINRLLRKSGHAVVTRSQDKAASSNDYYCQLTSTPKITLEWPVVPPASDLLDVLS